MNLGKTVASLLLLAVAAFQVAADDAKPMTNADVLAMIDAKLPESTIVLAITNAKADFDTDATALIELSKRNVPKTIVEAMIKAAGGGGEKAAGNSSATPEEITVRDGDSEQKMRYLTPNIRQAVRALGYGGVASYAALNGTNAALRLKSSRPVFRVAVPKNAQAQSYVTIVSLAVRRNGTREVMIGGGYMSYSTGINKDRVIPMTDHALEDQSQAPTGYEMHEISPQNDLPPGEYAVVLYNSEVQVAGWFVSGRDSYFDFGVDG